VNDMGAGAAIETLIGDCLAKLERQANTRRREELRREIRRCAAAGDEAALARAQKEHEALARGEIAAPEHGTTEHAAPDELVFSASPQLEGGSRA